MIQVKKFHPEKLMVQKIFGLKKMQLVEKKSTTTKFSIQNHFGSEKKGVQLNFGPKYVVVKKFCVEKVMGPNNFCVKENSWSKNNLRSQKKIQKYLASKNLGSKKFMYKNCFQKISKPKNIFGQKI